MRLRNLVVSMTLLAVIGLAALAGSAGFARAQDDGTPTVTDPAVAGTATAGDGTPTAVPAGAGVVTLVAWYTQDPSGEFLVVGPLRTSARLVAGPGEPAERQLTGQIDLDSPDNNEYPRFTLDDVVLNGVPVYPDDPNTVQRWIYYNDDPAARPSTLVIQVVGVSGPYADYSGTATFVSRASGAGGVLVIVLNPPAA